VKFLTLYIFVIATAIAGAKDAQKETKSPQVQVPSSQPVGDKFFKIPTKECKLEGATFEESLKACIKVERRWLHI